ncbi:MAG: large subunit ribosomal protein [Candidatus Methanomethylophilaceae archaeon]|jgi:large subunit ribosomal protein L6|nr:MAG: LSU ribosomal protein L6P [Thermoplasmatales archaeon 49_6]MDI3483094.1 large subunit ribosomal protein [Candidatus Methanomethylophilaceae archaeon]MDI3541665.1 large subunit ribosomal protein [Candidatus Methanomethylophilaceae archaeon]HIJ00408.1 50S ribosomal protein L6 [Candidatus Methanomethylophilaceae archaeon]
MTITGIIDNEIEIPEGVTVTKDGDILTVSGPKGHLSREFRYPRVELSVSGNVINIRSEFPRVREKAIVGTFESHIRNMMYGVKHGYTYKMKVVYSHFPMKVTVKDGNVMIDNYMGGKSRRYARIMPGVSVTVKGSDIIVEGIDRELCGQTAANIEKATRRRGFDRRVFQDGIYIVEKGRRVAE